ncbi:MAG: helix-turn-helix transcriptional regulator [Emcibacter sp.]|nr:helix-turn-helix transcriptional regulator [Emcibacter sp.]
MVNIQSSDWYSLLVQLQKKVGTSAFLPALSDTLRQVVKFDCSGVMFYNGSEVQNIYEGDFSPNFKKYIDLYLKGLYLLDPHYDLLAKGAKTGLYRFQDIAPDCYHDSEYYNEFIKHVGITDEYDFIIKVGNDYVDFYLDNLGNKFSEEDDKILAMISPMVLHLLEKHWEKYSKGSDLKKKDGTKKPYQNIFDSFGKSILTEREQQVVQYILNGHSSKSLALKLNISLSTVKIHRKHIYQKFDITTQSELFSLCIQSLSLDGLDESEDPFAILTRA